ncbi:MAG: GntR family transcriptional regulator [Tenericutes bacterium HGW-Tenericutes-1]|jgi:GntR family transcriptional regulator/MocR family aminotransferase|nr:MAG: GntR family transcriptional regulator [Tenericutes bacterium HGW-Tenericutes-1]
MITLFFERNSNQPLYEQLYRHIKSEIESGSLKNKDKLPSKRMLATHLKISPVTVETAYSLLVSEGYLKSIPKSGYYVENVPFPKILKTDSIKTDIIENIVITPYQYDFRTNSVDTDMFPYSVWSKLSRSVLSNNPHELLNALHPQGFKALRKEIAVYLYRYRGISAQPEQIIISSGSEMIYQQVIQFLGRLRVYATENPGYLKIKQLLKVNGCSYINVTLDPSGLSVSKLEKTEASIVHVTPSHQFPSGIVMPIKRRLELLQWANETEDRYIIEDDYDSEFASGNQPIPALQSLDHHEKVIYINTFSKSIAPSLRIGYFVLPPHLLKQYVDRQVYGSCTVPNFEQMILTKFLREGYFESHLNRMRSNYRKRRDTLMLELVNSGIVMKQQIFNYESGLHLIIQPSLNMSEEELVLKAKEHQIRVYGLSEYFVGTLPKMDSVIILGYTNMKLETIKEAVQALKSAWL